MDARGHGPTVLLVEDDASIAELVSAQLESRGFKVEWAEDGETGLWMTQSCRPKVVLLDLAMPILDGFGYLRYQRASSTIKDIPVIVMTARHEAEDVRTAVALGARDYITKPFTEELLVMRLERALRFRGVRRAAVAA